METELLCKNEDCSPVMDDTYSENVIYAQDIMQMMV